MAIARVSSDSSVENDIAASITLPFSTPAGSNRLMVGSGDRQSGTPWVSFAYNGDAGTLDVQQVDTASTNNSVVVFSLVAPDEDASTVKTINGLTYASVKTVDGLAIASVKTVDGIGTTIGNAVLTKSDATGVLTISVANYTGADQSGQPDATGSANSASASGLSYTVTTVQDSCWIMTGVHLTAGGAVTGTSNYATLETPTNGACFGDSNGSVGVAGSKTVSFTGGSGRWWAASASYSPA